MLGKEWENYWLFIEALNEGYSEIFSTLSSEEGVHVIDAEVSLRALVEELTSIVTADRYSSFPLENFFRLFSY